MSEATTRRRGRPAKPTDHPVGAHLRQRREQLGLTVRDVAVRAGLRRSSASYLSQLESGAKTPHPALARRLAEALDDDPRIYLAWSATGRHSGPVETARAVRALAELLHHPDYDLSPTGFPPIAGGAPETPVELLPLPSVPTAEPDARPPTLAPRPPGGGVPSAWLLVPELAEGADPGEDASGVQPLTTHRVAAEALAALEPLQRPFAYRVSEPGARRVRDLLEPGAVVVLTRRVWPPLSAACHAVRFSGHVVLARVLWNDRQLLLLPGPGERDFLVLDAPDRAAVQRLLVGRVAAMLRTQAWRSRTMSLPPPLARLARDCEITPFKSPGPGGQKKNKTESSVRVRHLPSGITRIATESRSQSRNREQALARVLAELERRARRPRPRRATRPSRLAVQRRLEAKRRAGERKRDRARLED